MGPCGVFLLWNKAVTRFSKRFGSTWFGKLGNSFHDQSTTLRDMTWWQIKLCAVHSVLNFWRAKSEEQQQCQELFIGSINAYMSMQWHNMKLMKSNCSQRDGNILPVSSFWRVQLIKPDSSPLKQSLACTLNHDLCGVCCDQFESPADCKS